MVHIVASGGQLTRQSVILKLTGKVLWATLGTTCETALEAQYCITGCQTFLLDLCDHYLLQSGHYTSLKFLAEEAEAKRYKV
jgi:hypothetical protein